MTNDKAKLGLLVIHGIGSQNAGYSKGIRAKVVDRMGEDANAVVWQEIL